MFTFLGLARDGRVGLRTAPTSQTWTWHRRSVHPTRPCPPCNRDPVDNSRRCSACRRHTQCPCNNNNTHHSSSMEGSNISIIHNNTTQLLRCQCTCKDPQDWGSRLLCQCMLLRIHSKGLQALPRSSSNLRQCLPLKVRHCLVSRSNCRLRQHRVSRRPRRRNSARTLSIPLL
jgi:hypothetical protein